MVALFSGGVIQHVPQVPTECRPCYSMFMLFVKITSKIAFLHSCISSFNIFFCCCDTESVQSASEGESPPQKAIGQSASMIRKGKAKFDKNSSITLGVGPMRGDVVSWSLESVLGKPIFGGSVQVRKVRKRAFKEKFPDKRKAMWRSQMLGMVDLKNHK